MIPSAPFAYGYDALGNRLSKTVGVSTDTYAYPATSNRLASITPASGPVRSYVHDGAGNVTADGVNTYAYDARGRLLSTSTTGWPSMNYNGLGQRTLRSPSPGVNTVYAYDEAGRLTTEVTSDTTTGNVHGVSYLYLEGAVVWMAPFTIPAPGAPAQYQGAFNVHPDHLDTPRLVTNSSNQAHWRWDAAEPFGSFPANENPQGLGIFPFNLRFPGQYFDKETNLHYNMMRDYDPGIGRYIQSDPIGLQGGLNTYAYVGSNPLKWIDPRGEAKWEWFFSMCRLGNWTIENCYYMCPAGSLRCTKRYMTRCGASPCQENVMRIFTLECPEGVTIPIPKF